MREFLRPIFIEVCRWGSPLCGAVAAVGFPLHRETIPSHICEIQSKDDLYREVEVDRDLVMASDAITMEELHALQKKLGNKQSFKEAVAAISSFLRDTYPSASPALCKSIYSTICRVATVLQTRYTAPGFWVAGLRLFEETEKLVKESSEKVHMKKCVARAREHLHEMENEVLDSTPRQPDTRYLFEGHLTVGAEPPLPKWLVAQNLLTTIAVAQDWTSIAESSRSQDNNNTDGEFPEYVRELISDMQEIGGALDLENVIEASLQEIGVGPHKPPPASKEVVENLPVIEVTEEIIAKLGNQTKCAVCREKLKINVKVQKLPCKHLFHPPCLKPWLDENNSCPICRYKLRTDDEAYERERERDREAEEDSKAAANSVLENFMYI